MRLWTPRASTDRRRSNEHSAVSRKVKPAESSVWRNQAEPIRRTLKRWSVVAVGATLMLGLPGAGAMNMLQSPISASAESAGDSDPSDVPADEIPADEIPAEPSVDDGVVDDPTTTIVVEPDPDSNPRPRPTAEAVERARAALRRCLAHHNVPDIDRLLAEHSPRELLRRCLAHHRCERRNGEAGDPAEVPVEVDLVLEDIAAQAADASVDRPDRCRRLRRPGAEPPVADRPNLPVDEAPPVDAGPQASGRAVVSRLR